MSTRVETIFKFAKVSLAALKYARVENSNVYYGLQNGWRNAMSTKQFEPLISEILYVYQETVL